MIVRYLLFHLLLGVNLQTQKTFHIKKHTRGTYKLVNSYAKLKNKIKNIILNINIYFTNVI